MDERHLYQIECHLRMLMEHPFTAPREVVLSVVGERDTPNLKMDVLTRAAIWTAQAAVVHDMTILLDEVRRLQRALRRVDMCK